MTVEPDVVRRKLLEINEATAHLRAWRPITVGRLQNVHEYADIKIGRAHV